MKKTLIAMLVLLMAASAFAANPVGKGMLYLEGSTSAGFAKGGGDAYKDFNGDTPTWIDFNPSVGYFFANGLAVGVTVNFDKMSWGDTKSTGFHFGPKLMWFPTAVRMPKTRKGRSFAISLQASHSCSTSDKTEIRIIRTRVSWQAPCAPTPKLLQVYWHGDNFFWRRCLDAFQQLGFEPRSLLLVRKRKAERADVESLIALAEACSV